MLDWLTNILSDLTARDVILAVGFFLISFVGSLALVSFVLVKLPPTYFQSSHARAFLTERHRVVRWSGMLIKNLVGLVLVVFGVLMSLPGVPGQGVLTVLLGVMLLDFPGKQRLEVAIVSRPRVLQTINRLRAKFEKPPLVLD